MERIIGSLRHLDANCDAQRIQLSSSTFRRTKGIPRNDMVDAWVREFTSSPGKELAFLYVANDVIQKSLAREGPDFANAFGDRLAFAFQIASQRDSKIRSKLDKLIDVWKDRNLYSSSMLKDFRKSMKQKVDTKQQQQQQQQKKVTKKRKSSVKKSSSSSPVRKKIKKSAGEKKRDLFGNVSTVYSHDYYCYLPAQSLNSPTIILIPYIRSYQRSVKEAR